MAVTLKYTDQTLQFHGIIYLFLVLRQKSQAEAEPQKLEEIKVEGGPLVLLPEGLHGR